MKYASPKFVQILILAVISLIITFFLFAVLQSYAEGNAPIIGGSIAYGGALAGFVVIFTILFIAYSKLSESDDTAIDISGKWFLIMTKNDGSMRSGRANIEQPKGSIRCEIAGQVDSVNTPPSTTFSSLVGVIKERRLVFIFENSRREMGIIFGDILEDNPDDFIAYYYDVLSTDRNHDPEGRLKFTRKEILLEKSA